MIFLSLSRQADNLPSVLGVGEGSPEEGVSSARRLRLSAWSQGQLKGKPGRKRTCAWCAVGL